MRPGLSARKLLVKLPYLVFRNETIEPANVCQITTEQKTRVQKSNTFQKTPLDKDEGIFGLGINNRMQHTNASWKVSGSVTKLYAKDKTQ